MTRRLATAAEDAGGASAALLRRAWLMGPHRVGPNVLLARETWHRVGGGLWEAPPAQLLRLGRREAASAEEEAHQVGAAGNKHDRECSRRVLKFWTV